MTDEELARLRAHDSNISRYRRLLKTKLSDLERRFLERRLTRKGRPSEGLSSSPTPRTGAAGRQRVCLILLVTREQKNTLGEMRSGKRPRRLLVYCRSWSMPPPGGDEVRLSDLSRNSPARPVAAAAPMSGPCSKRREWVRAEVATIAGGLGVARGDVLC